MTKNEAIKKILDIKRKYDKEPDNDFQKCLDFMYKFLAIKQAQEQAEMDRCAAEEKDYIINSVIRKIDFSTIQRTMKAMDWTWYGEDHAPTVKEIKAMARKLLSDTYDRVEESGEDAKACSGGFEAEGWIGSEELDGSDKIFLRLKFCIDDILSDSY